MSELKKYRYERKFVTSSFSTIEVEALIKMHPAMFSEVFFERWVRNIYFDSLELKNFYSNVNGDMQRRKARIRWYGATFGPIEHPVLEIKIKERSGPHPLDTFS